MERRQKELESFEKGHRPACKDKPPRKLLTTGMATMQDASKFWRLARLEAEKRGIRQAVEVIGIHDGGNWIDPLWEEHFGCHQRILDYDHAGSRGRSSSGT